MRRIIHSLLAWLLCLSMLCVFQPTLAAIPNEYQVKAAFLNNFARFMEWPANSFSSPSAPFVFGLLGDDPFEGLMEQTLNGKALGTRRIEFRRVKLGPDLRNCHLLFISSSEKRRFSQALKLLEGTSVVTISETPGFIGQGGMINFFVHEDRVQFEVAKTTIERAGLKISSRMLAVAKVV